MVKPHPLFLALLCCSIQIEKTARSVFFFLFTRNIFTSLSNVASTFSIFALAVFMPNVKWLQKLKVRPMKYIILCVLEELNA